uniref:OTU domain-containing protein 3-like isoform X2 n=1 Tax=Myxine glutinosa TaxID=7769 RepID=UPI00358E266F
MPRHKFGRSARPENVSLRAVRKRGGSRDRQQQQKQQQEANDALKLQLKRLGLTLREVAGDGNCLFRALGDQLEGHEDDHLLHRSQTIKYILTHRLDFEPFVEDDMPFERHVGNLSKNGTFAGNDAIVAFARNHQLTVVIHQLDSPIWEVKGLEKVGVRQLHIAYQHGDHYDSVRLLNDVTCQPTRICLQDIEMVAKEFREHNGDTDSGISSILQMMEVIDSSLITHGGSLLKDTAESLSNEPNEKDGIVMHDQKSCSSCGSKPNHMTTDNAAEKIGSTKNKFTGRIKKQQKRLQKKRQSEERHRQKAAKRAEAAALKENWNGEDASSSVVHTMATLRI